MKTERVYVYSMSTGYQFIKRGTSAKTIAAAISEISLLVAGYYSSSINLGTSILSIFETAAGANVVVSSQNDYTQVKLRYNGIKQWTYGDMGDDDWAPGYCSQSVDVYEETELQFFMIENTGVEKTTTQSESKTVKSEYFDSPLATAYYNLFSTRTEWVSYRIYGLEWLFL